MAVGTGPDGAMDTTGTTHTGAGTTGVMADGTVPTGVGAGTTGVAVILIWDGADITITIARTTTIQGEHMPIRTPGGITIGLT